MKIAMAPRRTLYAREPIGGRNANFGAEFGARVVIIVGVLWRALYRASTASPMEHEPGDYDGQHDDHQQHDLRVLPPPHPGFERLPGGIADARDERRPEQRADEIEECEPPWRDAAGTDQDRPGDAQAVAEAQQDHRRRVPAAHQRLHARRLGRERWKARDHARSVAPAQ